jgi:hypothetical protein
MPIGVRTPIRLASNTADITEALTELIARARTDEDVDVVYVDAPRQPMKPFSR